MFTDIEGSTRLLGALGGDSYGSLLQDHHELIVSSAERNGGRLVATEGDGCFIVFPTATQAAAAALTAQRDLAGHSWPAGVEVKVRMGLHTGSPVSMDENYVGMDVHRAARIADAAHGGQVIASSPTMQLTDELGVDWVSLGQYRLKDLKRPERLFQLHAPGLGVEFPPLRAPSWTSVLPEPPTRFVGRTEDVDAVFKMLAGTESRSVTLVGPGGIGKTRLAIRVGHRWAEGFADGVAFVPLAALTEAHEVAAGIAVEVGASDGDDPSATLVEHLHDLQLLLILDNFEHLPPAAFILVADLAARCPSLRVLVTSRAPLHLSGERLYPLSPLEVAADPSDIEAVSRSEAVALFVDRAKAVVPAFEVTSGNVGAIVEICRRLDGIPLAIELAAAQLAILSPAELVDRFTIEMLSRGPADLEERQRTLRATIEWSYRLLDNTGRKVFTRMSVFAGGATLSDLDAVVVGEDGLDVLGGVGSLLSQSLLRRDETDDGTSRFRMLGTVREFARSELERLGELSEVSARHAEHFLAFMRTANDHLDGAEADEWMKKIEEETPDLKAALRWALEDPHGSREIGIELANAMGWFWYVRGDPTDALRWLEVAFRFATETPLELKVRLVYYSAAMLERLSRLDAASARFEEALAMFRELGDEQRVAMTLNSLGGLLTDAGDVSGALERLGEAERLLASQGDDYGQAVNLVNLCDAALTMGELDRAEDLGRRGHDLFLQLENDWGAAMVMRHLAKVAYERGDMGEARRRLVAALGTSHRLGDRAASVRCLERLAGVEIALDESLRGTRLAAAAEKLRREIGDLLSGPRRQSFQASWDAARTLLGDPEFERVWEQGANMTFDQAVDYALSPTAHALSS
jgi:predicted ATPase/class 3 adenylate cyclase